MADPFGQGDAAGLPQRHRVDATREQLASVAVKNHQNGAKNPLAHMRKVITMEQALAGKPIAEPLTVYDCSLISDGVATMVTVAPAWNHRSTA